MRQEESVSYSYRLKPGINYNSHAIVSDQHSCPQHTINGKLAARMAGMPPEFMKVAQEKLVLLQREKAQDDKRRQTATRLAVESGDAAKE
jgi:hypothetical protein